MNPTNDLNHPNHLNDLNQIHQIDQINETDQTDEIDEIDGTKGIKKTEPKGAPFHIGGHKGSNYPQSSRALRDAPPGCKTYSPQLTVAFCFEQLSHNLLNRCLERKERLHFKHLLLSRRLWVSLSNIGSLLNLLSFSYQQVKQWLFSTTIENQWSISCLKADQKGSE
jgi:hypothetical protein